MRRQGCTFTLSSPGSLEALVGTHRVQRVPEGENRRHTSTVTVALLSSEDSAFKLSEADIELITYRGSGPGGQHRNTSDTAVRARHLPTGLEAKSEAQRSWWQNRDAAVNELTRRVAAAEASSAHASRNAERVDQIGLGDRVSHDWTWCAWRNTVTSHSSGETWQMSKALRGRFL